LTATGVRSTWLDPGSQVNDVTKCVVGPFVAEVGLKLRVLKMLFGF